MLLQIIKGHEEAIITAIASIAIALIKQIFWRRQKRLSGELKDKTYYDYNYDSRAKSIGNSSYSKFKRKLKR